MGDLLAKNPVIIDADYKVGSAVPPIVINCAVLLSVPICGALGLAVFAIREPLARIMASEPNFGALVVFTLINVAAVGTTLYFFARAKQ